MMLYIIGVLITASVVGNRIYSIAYSVCSLLGFNFFTDPKFSFSAYDPSYPLTFLLLFLASLMTETLVNRIKTQARQAETTAYRTAVLFRDKPTDTEGERRKRDCYGNRQAAFKAFWKTVYYYAVDGSGLKPRGGLFQYGNTGSREDGRRTPGGGAGLAQSGHGAAGKRRGAPLFSHPHGGAYFRCARDRAGDAAA